MSALKSLAPDRASRAKGFEFRHISVAGITAQVRRQIDDEELQKSEAE
ncbi:MAG: hypothetical protein ACK4Z8_11815 [Novosphingobium sp.]